MGRTILLAYFDTKENMRRFEHQNPFVKGQVIIERSDEVDNYLRINVEVAVIKMVMITLLVNYNAIPHILRIEEVFADE